MRIGLKHLALWFFEMTNLKFALIYLASICVNYVNHLKQKVWSTSFWLFVILVNGCQPTVREADLVINTQFGPVFIRLFDEVPNHKSQILADVDSGHYEQSEIFRVVEDFVIQGGISSQSLDTTKQYPRLNPEILPEHNHFKGTVAIPRLSDDLNPYRRSAPLQFYIVTGRTYTDEELNDIEQLINQFEKKNQAVRLSLEPANQWLRAINTDSLAKSNPDSLKRLNQWIEQEIDRRWVPFRFSKSAREKYKTKGGTPMLDGQYTIVGEVVQGISTVENIAKSLTHPNSDRPLEPIPITLKKVTN